MLSKILTLVNGKISLWNIWDIFLLYKTKFLVGEDIDIPQDLVLQMHSPEFDGELKISGEAYIL